MFFKVILSVLLISLAPFSASADTVEEARKPVDRLNQTLIEVMKNAKELGYQGRYKKLEPVVKDVFEFEAVSQLALGGHWKKLDKEQKVAFMQKLTEVSIATYAAQFNSYGGELFRFDSSEEAKSGRLVLHYNYGTRKEKKPIKFDYYVSEFNGQWQIINIVVDGISDLALKKAQYTSIIDREGFDSLLGKLSQQIANYANNNGGSGNPG
jgi:phospholipid transport system substrate-binding protein